MARPTIQITFLILTSLCFLSNNLIAAQEMNGHFFVEGVVYCDPCRAQFVTRLSHKLSGAKVKLECRERVGEKVIYTTEGETDEGGMYKLRANGEFQDDVCDVSLVSSPDPDCAEISDEGFHQPGSIITLTSNNGMTDTTRRPNPLFFMKKEPLSECVKVYEEMDIPPPDHN